MYRINRTSWDKRTIAYHWTLFSCYYATRWSIILVILSTWWIIHSADLLTGNTWGWCSRVTSADRRTRLLISSTNLSIAAPGRRIGTTMSSSPLAFLEVKRKLASQEREPTASAGPPYTGLPHPKSRSSNLALPWIGWQRRWASFCANQPIWPFCTSLTYSLSRGQRYE